MPDAINGDAAAEPQRPALPVVERPVTTEFPMVGIGASAGGLEACRRLLQALPRETGMAFILVQHLDPTYPSIMAELLAGQTHMKVQQAADGMKIEPEHLYVIPPGSNLSIEQRVLRLTPVLPKHSARLPFDFLLQSMARELGPTAACVVLSGTGSDGCAGLRALSAAGGLVIAQEPSGAEYDGMPMSAIATGAVDIVAPIAEIPDHLLAWQQRAEGRTLSPITPRPESVLKLLPNIIELLRTGTVHDFTHYKPGTLQRRIERRIALAGVQAGDATRYLEMLKSDPAELDQLAKDLLINVTSFFRDPKVFDYFQRTVVPELIEGHPADRPLRIWIAGCSTGEEAYSVAILLRERITAANSRVKLQLFASDVDADAIESAREGLYPETIKSEVSPERLARFFVKERQSYRVSPELRGLVIFSVQDLLTDPPFSRMDLISCRNMLIYLEPDAQAKLLSLFHFALREGGILLLGNSETIGIDRGRFDVISKTDRIYRHVGKRRTGDLDFVPGRGDSARAPQASRPIAIPTPQAALAEFCRKLVMESFAPAAILINAEHECLFFSGPTDRYLGVSPGAPTHDLLTMAREGLGSKINAALRAITRDKTRVVIPGGKIHHNGHDICVTVDVQPVVFGGDNLFLVCFIDEPNHQDQAASVSTVQDLPRIVELEQELETKKSELRDAIRELDASNEEQKAINEEALSVNEEYQSTNEELVTSKEELQSLNEELTALNTQLHEALERQRTTSDDLQNVLYSTDVATLFLDTSLRIRFFTPATKSLFKMITTDIGRPLADLNSLSADTELPGDAHRVLETVLPIEREIQTQDGAWFMRRTLPYRTHSGSVEGVVITFTDITERKKIKAAMEVAKLQAESANAAKSRFLAVASHDLRQPLQTLALLQGLLARLVDGDKAKKLVARIDETLGAISSMLNTLLDINQIDTGTIKPEIIDFSINDIFQHLTDEFAYHAQAQGLGFRVVPCNIRVRSDPRMLEQMIRNLLSNAFKYTKNGNILLGCLRHDGILAIEIIDTGVGIPESKFKSIFDEYFQLDNAARERSRGLGLGLSIVQRLGNLLGHSIKVRSVIGKGSAFSIEITQPRSQRAAIIPAPAFAATPIAAPEVLPVGKLLVVEDDPDVRELLEELLTTEGHRVVTASDAVVALATVTRTHFRPDLLLTDFNLPNGPNGLDLVIKLRESLHYDVPGIIITGDISTGTLRDIAFQKCVRLNKPVKLAELSQAIQRLLPISRAAPEAPVVSAIRFNPTRSPLVYVVDDDAAVRGAISAVLEDDGRSVQTFASCKDFLDAYRPEREGCLLIDAYLPDMSGLELLAHLNAAGRSLPSIMITGSSDVPMAVQAMKAGAADFIEKPIGRAELLTAIDRTMDHSRDRLKLDAWHRSASEDVAGLTARQREIMQMVVAGQPSKNIAADLGISQRTVENHRAEIMKRTGSKSLPALARLAVAAGWNGADDA